MSVLIVALLMFVVAIIFSMIGLGGGVLYTPIQVWAGIDFHKAAATSLFLIMVVSLSASLVFRKAKRIDWPLSIILESATIIGGFLGGLYSSKVPGSLLSLLFALVVAAAGSLMIRMPTTRASTQPNQSRFHWQRRVGEQAYQVNLGIGLPASFLAGLVCGMVGVGGGILKVPLMILLLGVPVEIAIGSSALMMGLTAASGFGGHLVRGDWDWRLSLVLAVAVAAGGQIGSRISIRLDKQKLKCGFGWFLLIISLSMVAWAIVEWSRSP